MYLAYMPTRQASWNRYLLLYYYTVEASAEFGLADSLVDGFSTLPMLL